MNVKLEDLESALSRLLRHPGRALIGGKWVEGATGQSFVVSNPSTGELIANVADCTVSDIESTVDRAEEGLAVWGSATNQYRYEIMRAATDRLRGMKEELALLISSEAGKPLAEARAEADTTIRFLDWFSHEALRLSGEAWPKIREDRDALVFAEPVGVVAAITPWNFPGFLVACKVAAALAAGCSVVLKPAEQTPLTAYAIADAFDAVGLPAGVLNVITTSTPANFGDFVGGNPRVGCVTFTGSRSVGERLLRASAASMQKVLLELGGNSPAIVLDDADLDQAAQQLTRSRFSNTGQVCVATNRIYVQESVSEEFRAKLSQSVSALTLGDAVSSGADLGPLIDTAAVERLESLVEAATDAGASVLIGGQRERSTGSSAFFQATVLETNDDSRATILAQEMFGPVLAFEVVRDEDEAVRRANESDWGLAAYVFTGSSSRGISIARRLHAGSVGVNCALVSDPQTPFGGMRASGIGRERAQVGVQEFLEYKTVQVAR